MINSLGEWEKPGNIITVSWGAKGLESCIGSRPLQPSLCILCELQLIEPLGGVLQFVQHTVRKEVCYRLRCHFFMYHYSSFYTIFVFIFELVTKLRCCLLSASALQLWLTFAGVSFYFCSNFSEDPTQGTFADPKEKQAACQIILFPALLLYNACDALRRK